VRTDSCQAFISLSPGESADSAPSSRGGRAAVLAAALIRPVRPVRPVGPVRPVWWSEQWIPFAYDGVGDLQCIDLDPPEGGKVGQVVTYWHDRGEREHVADSLNEWLAHLADDLEAGKYSRAGNSC